MSKMITLLKDYFRDLVEGYKTPLDMDKWSKFYKKHWKGTAVSCIIAAIGGIVAGASIATRQRVLKTKAEAFDKLYEEYVHEEPPRRLKDFEDYSMKEGRRHRA